METLKAKLYNSIDISSSGLSKYIVEQARNIETDRNPKKHYKKNNRNFGG